ncbi:MAG: F0F1 ATP synthase subunit A [Chloroflexi bacterium]|nr:MAG: F0F1 ATP synthase subunit A [Chloroflexota bacterium]
MTRNRIIALVVSIALLVLGIFLPFSRPPILVAAEPIPSPEHPWTFFGLFPITNALLTTWLTMLFLVVFSLVVTRNMELVPEGVQNAMEMIIEAVYGLVEDVAGARLAPAFFPLVATIFFFVLISNWIDLLTPILAAVGFREVHEGKDVIIPLLRSPSTDLNFTLALALISVTVTQAWGIRELGVMRYAGKFININGFRHFFHVLTGREEGSATGALMMGFLDFYIGIVEMISELAKIISFSFRLFGNIFAGEVLLLVMPSFLSMFLILPFLGLEVFVGLIQAFIFAVLTLAFMTMAIISLEGH